MSDTAQAAVPAESSPRVKSKRGRRILALVSYFYPPARQAQPTCCTGSSRLRWRRRRRSEQWRDVGALDLRHRQDGSRVSRACSGGHDGSRRFDLGGRRDSQVAPALHPGRPLSRCDQGPGRCAAHVPGRFAIGPDGSFYVVRDVRTTRPRPRRAATEDVGSFQIPKPVSVAVSDDRIVVGAISGFAILDKTASRSRSSARAARVTTSSTTSTVWRSATNGNIYVDGLLQQPAECLRSHRQAPLDQADRQAQQLRQTEDGGPLTVPEPKDAGRSRATTRCSCRLA